MSPERVLNLVLLILVIVFVVVLIRWLLLTGGAL